jgi:hypothetical protein
LQNAKKALQEPLSGKKCIFWVNLPFPEHFSIVICDKLLNNILERSIIFRVKITKLRMN